MGESDWSTLGQVTQGWANQLWVGRGLSVPTWHPSGPASENRSPIGWWAWCLVAAISHLCPLPPSQNSLTWTRRGLPRWSFRLRG